MFRCIYSFSSLPEALHGKQAKCPNHLSDSRYFPGINGELSWEIPSRTGWILAPCWVKRIYPRDSWKAALQAQQLEVFVGSGIFLSLCLCVLQFQKEYPQIYRSRFPTTETEALLLENKPTIKQPMLSLRKPKFRSLRYWCHHTWAISPRWKSEGFTKGIAAGVWWWLRCRRRKCLHGHCAGRCQNAFFWCRYFGITSKRKNIYLFTSY